MTSTSKRYTYIIFLLGLCLSISGFCRAQDKTAPFYISGDLFDTTQPDTLGLNVAPGAETFAVYSPTDTGNKYNHGAVLIAFKGHLYVQWQTSKQDEDAPDTWVAYSRSIDGKKWPKSMVLAPQWNSGIRSSGGWWTDGEMLIAYINVWPGKLKPRGGYTEYMTSTDGLNWTEPKRLLNNNGKPIRGVFEQDPRALPSGRIIGAIHEQPGLIVSPYYTDDPKGLKGWTKGRMHNLPYDSNVSRELEPSWFRRADGHIVMIFRDQAGSFKKLASVSEDHGETWSTPVLTDMPDSRSKQSAGNLPDGTAFMVNNPTNSKTRYPLIITLSKDGVLFDTAYLLRAGGNDLPPLRYEGLYKRPGYSYPKSFVDEDFLYVAYATNKEDVEITRVPIKRLSLY